MKLRLYLLWRRGDRIIWDCVLRMVFGGIMHGCVIVEQGMISE